jgi:hypothetical protein
MAAPGFGGKIKSPCPPLKQGARAKKQNSCGTTHIGAKAPTRMYTALPNTRHCDNGRGISVGYYFAPTRGAVRAALPDPFAFARKAAFSPFGRSLGSVRENYSSQSTVIICKPYYGTGASLCQASFFAVLGFLGIAGFGIRFYFSDLF